MCGWDCGVLRMRWMVSPTTSWLVTVYYTWCVEECVVYCACAEWCPHHSQAAWLYYTWCEEEFVVYCAYAEWCPPLLAGWLYYTWCGEEFVVYCTMHNLHMHWMVSKLLDGWLYIPGVWRSLWCTAPVRMSWMVSPTTVLAGWLYIPGVRRSLWCTTHALNGVPY